jgi:hypothetical protein
VNVRELLVMTRRRLFRKAKQAEQAYINEYSVKVTLNCVNHGRKLSDGCFHCKINAMGLYEERASQCWNQKASICPVFERKRDIEELRRDFRKISPNELAIRWPSLGELIRFEALLSQLDELRVDANEEETQSGVRLLGDVRLQPASTEGVSPDSGHVRRDIQPYGSGDVPSSTEDRLDTGGKPDSGSPKPGPDYPSSVSVAAVSEPGNRERPD